MEEKIIGIKGFDKDLKCRNYQFRIGKTFEEDLTPKLCGRGFHYCQTLSDVFQYYPNKNGNRFCVIEVLGKVESGVDKCCTNKIKIVRELNRDEICSGITQEELGRKLREMNDNGFIIGGSFALKAHGYIIDRDLSDIDLITTNSDRSAVLSKFKNMASIKEFSSRDSICSFKGVLGEKYDILFNTNAHAVEREYLGHKINVQDDVEIWSVKLKYALNGMKKHMDDILKNNISFSMNPRIQDDNSLPF